MKGVMKATHTLDAYRKGEELYIYWVIKLPHALY